MISNLQLLRAVAALSVVFYHCRYPLNGVLTDFLGVCVFFVISGFIMTHVTRAGAELFMVKRLIRIVPLYWICTVVFLFWTNLGLSNPFYTYPLFWKWAIHDPWNLLGWVKANHGLGAPGAALGLLKSLMFIPYENHGTMYPLLAVGWTLNLEMFFYVLFAIALKVSQKYAPGIVCAALGLVQLAIYALGVGNPAAFYAHPYVWCFVLGIVVFYVWRAFETDIRNVGVMPFAILSGLFLVWFICLNTELIFIGRMGTGIRTAANFVSSMVAVLLALCLHTAGARCGNRFVLLLGSASYSLYLCHYMVVTTMDAMGPHVTWLNTKVSLLAVVIAMCTSILLAISSYMWIERPLTNILRGWFERPRSSSAFAA